MSCNPPHRYRVPAVGRAICGLLIGLVAGSGCGTFLTQPTASPPSEEARRAMRAEQAKDQARAEQTQRQIDSIRSRRQRPLQPDRRVVQPYHVWTTEQTAIDALGRIGQAAVPALSQALRDPRQSIRLRAASVLARIGPDAVEAVPDLVERLSDVDPAVRKAAARALGQIGPEAKSAVPALMQLLQQP